MKHAGTMARLVVLRELSSATAVPHQRDLGGLRRIEWKVNVVLDVDKGDDMEARASRAVVLFADNLDAARLAVGVVSSSLESRARRGRRDLERESVDRTRARRCGWDGRSLAACEMPRTQETTRSKQTR